jgi:3-oxoacyl-[acyl-carrier protein] reductase
MALPSPSESSTCLVTGASSGIGVEIARQLALRGLNVTLVARREDRLRALSDELERDHGVHADVVAADVASEEGRSALIDGVRANGRDVDVLVNNAGAYIAGDETSLGGVAERWRANLDSNVLTAVLMTTALLPSLRRPGGRIVLTSSIAAQRGGGGPYSAAKAALHGYALDLATRLGEEGITANVIAPGYVVDSEFFDGRMTPEGHRKRVDATLVKRPGEPSDIAEAVRWLAGPGGTFVTGQIINVNGGSVLGR